MTAGIFTIGTEVTRGELVNTNASWLAERLTELGFRVTEHVSVEDDVDHIVETLHRLARECRVVVVTGGLGPTSDDITAACAAQALGVPLCRDIGMLQDITEKLSARGRALLGIQQKQADLPQGADALPNAVGTAPGFRVVLHDAELCFLPGVPSEMKPMFDNYVAPHIAQYATHTLYQVRLRTFGLPEAEIAHKLRDIEAQAPDIIMGYRNHFPETEVKVLAKGRTPQEAEQRSKDVAEGVRQCLGEIVYGEGQETYAAFVGQCLRAKRATLAVAESCTGGLVGHMLTTVPGSSDYLLMDAVTYSNQAKTALLGVDPEILRVHGAVSSETARAMAEGARNVVQATIGVSVTGVAGPSGGTAEKPVGTVWFGLAIEGKPTHTEVHHLAGGRERIRTLSAYLALRLVVQASKDLPTGVALC